VLPGYYNSAYGVTTTVAPSRQFYASWGGYDGNGARGVQTGLQATPTFNAYKFQIGETGTAWRLGPDNLPGAAAIGGWDQTGTLTLSTSTPQHEISQNGTHGVYAFASQRLWRGNGGDDQASGVSGFIQLGINNSRTTMFATRYVGLGLTAFGMIPGRPADSFGAGLAWSGLNRNGGNRPDEALIQVYDQIQVFGSFYLQPTLTFRRTRDNVPRTHPLPPSRCSRRFSSDVSAPVPSATKRSLWMSFDVPKPRRELPSPSSHSDRPLTSRYD
jgi:porin